MTPVHDDQFVLFVRMDPTQTEQPLANSAEQPLASCSTYEEARLLRRQLQGSTAGECVIRYVGPAGGGD